MRRLKHRAKRHIKQLRAMKKSYGRSEWAWNLWIRRWVERRESYG